MGLRTPSPTPQHTHKTIQAERRETGQASAQMTAFERGESPPGAHITSNNEHKSRPAQWALNHKLPQYTLPRLSRSDEYVHSKTSLANEASQVRQSPCDTPNSPGTLIIVLIRNMAFTDIVSASQSCTSSNTTVGLQQGAIPQTTESQNFAAIKNLLQQNDRLKKELQTLSRGSNERDVKTEWLVAHRVFCPFVESHATYLDTPVWLRDEESNHQHLDARRRIPSENSWEEKQESVSFVAYLEYHCEDHPENTRLNRQNLVSRRQKQKARGIRSASEITAHRGEEVFIRSTVLREALEERMSQEDGLNTYLQSYFLETGRIRAPFLMYYHFKKALCRPPESMPAPFVSGYHSLMEYFDARTAVQSRLADEMIGLGRVTREYIPYLFAPGQILLRQGKHGLCAVKQKSRIGPVPEDDEEDDDVDLELISAWKLDIELVHFDGEFRSQTDELILPFPDDEVVVDIASLELYPLSSTNQSIREDLIERGRLFWECRKGKYMAIASDSEKTNQDVRYMVDAKTYRLVHKSHIMYNQKNLPPNKGGQEDDDFFLRLPDSIEAFNMQEKKWHTVAVDSLKHVSWNSDAFDSLAVDQKTKTILEAVVTNKIDADRGTDVVGGKGTGLIVLLHGGPGTGKTLTAESVAEFAKKPLYRITCGDVGTQPKEVEEYLESAFQLGRTWDCVVLLDEADVFLEQRSFQNLERNALVSVFLRVLEYYDGILLLTSNRVGTFDEAFKSRIQLALHYDSLDQNQREQIWTNFINRLEYLEVEVDFVGIRKR